MHGRLALAVQPAVDEGGRDGLFITGRVQPLSQRPTATKHVPANMRALVV